MIKQLIRKFIPKSVLRIYHKTIAWCAAAFYGFPGRKLIVIGVTGTNGKSTTCNMIAQVLEGVGYKVGMTTTVNFRINGREWLNDRKMTMLGRTQLQKLLRKMKNEGCEIAVVEVSSEGLAQGRNTGIVFDIAVFTNLTPEHIESHGSFENYKRAKGILFSALKKFPQKTLRGKKIPKTIITNATDPHSSYFAGFSADEKLQFNTEQDQQLAIHLAMPGEFNLENARAALQVAMVLGVEKDKAIRILKKMPGVPGRMERIQEGQSFDVIVDYAPEPASFTKLYEAVMAMPHKRIIHVFGSCGGGRDRDRRPVLGEIAGKRADIVIITNEDPYDDDPMEIINEVAAGAKAAGKIEAKNLFIEPDRRVAIHRALETAEADDLVLVTGKGAEQAICVANGKKIPWDDRKVIREELLALK